MQVSVETTEGLERRMTVEVPQERIESEVENRLQQLARTTRIKGFRPGKVPLRVVRQHYGTQVRQEVLGEVMQSTFYEAVTQEKLRPVGLPQIEPKDMEAGRDLSYTATFEVFPEIGLADLSSVEIEKPVGEVSDADVDKMIDTLRKQATEWTDADRAAKDGDRVYIDFEGTIEGEPFDGNKGEDVPVTLGGGRMIEGFEKGITGAKAGDDLVLDLTFPEDYAYEAVAGKPVQFAIKVKKVQEPKLPEIDDAFAARFGVKEGGVEGLRNEVRQNMERELTQALANQVKRQVMDKLLEVNTFDIPSALIENEQQALKQQAQQHMHIPPGKEGIDLDASMFGDEARRRVALGLIVAEIVRANEIRPDAAKVRETVESLASSYEQPEEVVKWYYSDRKRLGDIESLVLEEEVVERVLSEAKVNEAKKSFEEVMNQAQLA